MQRPDTGEFVHGESVESLRAMEQSILDSMEPKKRSSLEDDRHWPIFRVGETVQIQSNEGGRATCVVESIGKKFIRLRGIPVQG